MIQRSERGAAVTEIVLVFPALLFMVLLVFQFALVMHTQNLVTAAAQDAARAARVEGGSSAAASEAAASLLADSGATISGPASVEVERDDAFVRVSVSAEVLAVVPGFGLEVDARAVAPTERFRARS